VSYEKPPVVFLSYNRRLFVSMSVLLGSIQFEKGPANLKPFSI